MRTMPTRSKARSVAEMPLPPIVAGELKVKAPPPVWPAFTAKPGVLARTQLGSAPLLIEPVRDTPSCSMMLRCISTTRTWTITWSDPAIDSMLSTWSGVSTKVAATRWMRSLSPALSTVPVRMMAPLMASAVTLALGAMRRMVSCNAPTGAPTRTLRLRI